MKHKQKRVHTEKPPTENQFLGISMMYSANCESQNSLHMYGQLSLILAQIASCNDEWT